MLLKFILFLFLFQVHAVLSIPCIIFAKNDSNSTISNISNLTQNGSQTLPYVSFLEAISGIVHCDANASEVNIYLLSDFYTISSYEINILRKKNNAFFYQDEFNIFYLFKGLRENIRSLSISSYIKERNSQIAVKDQNISFWIDQFVSFRNIKFTGIDINLDFNASLHRNCFFEKIECCLIFSCFKELQILNTTLFYRHGLFILEAGTIYLYKVSFFSFESYQLTTNPTYSALFTSRNHRNSINIYDSFFSELFFINGIFLLKSFKNLNMVNSKFEKFNMRENMKVSCEKLIVLDSIRNLNFENIVFENINALSLFSFNYSNARIINMTLVQKIFQNTKIFLVFENCWVRIQNVLLGNLNFSTFLQINNNNKLTLKNVFVHNVSLKHQNFIFANTSNLIYFENFNIKVMKDAYYLIYLFRNNTIHFVRGNWELINFTNNSFTSNKMDGTLYLNYLNNCTFVNSIFQKINASSLNYIFMRNNNIIILRKLMLIQFSFQNYGQFICTNDTNFLIIEKNNFFNGVTQNSGCFSLKFSQMSLSKGN